MTVAVLTDPSAVVPSLGALPVTRVPIEIAWADGHLEAGDQPYSAIADRLRSEAQAPTTGAPSPGTFAQLIGDLLATNDGVLVICPPKDLSTTINSAVIAAREFDAGRVDVMDANTAAGGQGLVVAEAAAAAAAGLSLVEVRARADAVSERVKVWATLAQMAYMKRSGRLPSIAAIGADALKIQPLVRYTGSSPAPVGVVRSTERATEKILGAWERTIVDAPLRALAFHSDRADDAAVMGAEIARRIPDADVEAVEVTAALASHTGPGLLGLAWFWDN